MSEKWVFFNGAFCLEKQGLIPVTDRGFLFGDGIFTTIRVDQGKCEFLQSHLQRLRQHAEFLKFHLNLEKLEWESEGEGEGEGSWISEFIQRQSASNGTWRLKIVATVKEEKGIRETGHILATLEPYHGNPFDPCTLCLFPFALESSLASIKSLSYLEHLHVRGFAQQRGFADAITCSREGFLLETGCSNLFWIDQGKCWIPDPQLPYLKGIFLQSILPYVDSVLPVQKIRTTLERIPTTASVYICNSLTHVRPVLSIDDLIFQRHAETENLLQRAIMQALQ